VRRPSEPTSAERGVEGADERPRVRAELPRHRPGHRGSDRGGERTDVVRVQPLVATPERPLGLRTPASPIWAMVPPALACTMPPRASGVMYGNVIESAPKIDLPAIFGSGTLILFHALMIAFTVLLNEVAMPFHMPFVRAAIRAGIPASEVIIAPNREVTPVTTVLAPVRIPPNIVDPKAAIRVGSPDT
jgi:hypothetical protein